MKPECSTVRSIRSSSFRRRSALVGREIGRKREVGPIAQRLLAGALSLPGRAVTLFPPARFGGEFGLDRELGTKLEPAAASLADVQREDLLVSTALRAAIGQLVVDAKRVLALVASAEALAERLAMNGVCQNILATRGEAEQMTVPAVVDPEPRSPALLANPVAAPDESTFRKEGEYWTLGYQGGAIVRLKNSKGLNYLAELLRAPGRELHVLDLIAAVEGPPAESAPGGWRDGELTVSASQGHSGELLDARARRAYRRRIEELREELAEAESRNDGYRASMARGEIDLLLEELAAGMGLGGRQRSVAPAVERARDKARKSLQSALAKISESQGPLGHHLSSCVKTGVFCSYEPDPARPIAWRL